MIALNSELPRDRQTNTPKEIASRDRRLLKKIL
jgi:hypothetical protein